MSPRGLLTVTAVEFSKLAGQLKVRIALMASVASPFVFAAAMADRPSPKTRQLLIACAFGAWHGLLTEPTYHRPLVYGTIASAMYMVVSLVFAYRLLRNRDIGG